MTTGNIDVDTMAAEPLPLTLASGLEIKVERLRLRAMLSLLKILTRGASSAMESIVVTADTAPEQFGGAFLAAVILAIPEAEEETIEFLNRMVTTASGTPEDEDRLRAEMGDPELSDMVTILEQVITVETPHVMALGKQLAVLIKAQWTSISAKQGSSSKRSSKR